MQVRCEQLAKPCRVSATVKAQRLILCGYGLGDLLISSALLNDRAHNDCLPSKTSFRSGYALGDYPQDHDRSLGL